LLDVTEITKIAVSFHCDICNIFSTHYCRATAGMNGKMVIQKVGKYCEQNLVGCFHEIKINNGISHCFKRKKHTTSIVTHLTWNGPVRACRIATRSFCFNIEQFKISHPSQHTHKNQHYAELSAEGSNW